MKNTFPWVQLKQYLNKINPFMVIGVFFILFLLINEKNVQAEAIPGDSIYQVNTEWTTQSEKPLKISDFKGHYVVISMIYLGCASSCPMTVAKMKDVEKLLSEESQAKTKFVLVTFDFKRDTPAVMLKYAKKTKLNLDRWTFLRSKNESTVRELSNLIDFKYKELSNGEFDHSFALVALDTEGRILGRTEGVEMNPKSIAELINSKFKNKESELNSKPR